MKLHMWTHLTPQIIFLNVSVECEGEAEWSLHFRFRKFMVHWSLVCKKSYNIDHSSIFLCFTEGDNFVVMHYIHVANSKAIMAITKTITWLPLIYVYIYNNVLPRIDLCLPVSNFSHVEKFESSRLGLYNIPMHLYRGGKPHKRVSLIWH